jgi:hypothetical protein
MFQKNPANARAQSKVSVEAFSEKREYTEVNLVTSRSRTLLSHKENDI